MFGIVVLLFFCWGGFQVSRKLLSNSTKSKNVFEPKIPLQFPADNSVRPKQQSRNDRVSSGILYLIFHTGLNAQKIGISNSESKTDRLQSHMSRGWQIDTIWNFEDFSSAQNVEGLVIAWWRNVLGIEPICTSDAMPQGGYTETSSLDSVEIGVTREFAEKACVKSDGRRALLSPISDLVPGASMRVAGTLQYASLDSKTSVFSGTYRTQTRVHEWQRWVLEDESGCLLIELRSSEVPAIHELSIGSPIEVIGRVELVSGQLRMTNPIYRIEDKPKSKRDSTRVITNMGIHNKHGLSALSITRVADLVEGLQSRILVTVTKSSVKTLKKTRQTSTTIHAEDESGKVSLKFTNQSWRLKQLEIGSEIDVTGIPRRNFKEFHFQNPTADVRKTN